MRIAHLADAHLGFRQFQRLDAEGVNRREMDVALAFRHAIDQVIERKPDAIVIAGDLFHTVRPTNRAIIEAFTQLSRLRYELPGAPVVLIAGNHDTPRSLEAGSILKLMTSLGVDVVDEGERRLDYPVLGLSVLAVPHAALLGERPAAGWHPDPGARFNVLVMHPEIAGLFPEVMDYGGARVEAPELRSAEWSYVALGHYHVVHEVAPKAWYAGSLEYTSPNLWGEWRQETRAGYAKGWLLADLEAGGVERIALPAGRRIIDLEPLDAAGRTAQELDAAIAARVEAVPGGIAGAVVRLVVENVPRTLGHALDHGALRVHKAAALHFQLDLRRPDPFRRVAASGAPPSGRRPPLAELVGEFLARRPLDADLDRDRFVGLGREAVEAVERELQEDGA
jgi:DNA repair exonuclease SbcCD nuclease subunit